MRSFFALLALVSSACAYQVITPGNSNGWTTGGPNIVTWQRVDTDAQNFTMVLVNQVGSSLHTASSLHPASFLGVSQNQAVLSGGQEILVALVNGSALTYTVPPPSAGFPPGTGFQVNFVKDAQSLTTIYAQSGQFAITASSSTTSPSRTAASASACVFFFFFHPLAPIILSLDMCLLVLHSTSVNPTAADTTDTSGDLNPTGTSTSSGNSADRIAAAGSTALLFAALTAYIL